jgi:phospholipase/lecithinase/hemolysin
MHHAFNEVLENPEVYGFNNITDTCVDAVADEVTRKSVLKMVAKVTPTANSSKCPGYLFFDLVHPTAIAHLILAEKARQILDDAGVEISD